MTQEYHLSRGFLRDNPLIIRLTIVSNLSQLLFLYWVWQNFGSDLFLMESSAIGLCDYYINFGEMYFKLNSRGLKLKEIQF